MTATLNDYAPMKITLIEPAIASPCFKRSAITLRASACTAAVAFVFDRL